MTPHTEVLLAGAVPAWVLRLVLPLVVVGSALVLTTGTVPLVVAVALGVLLAWRPHAGLAGLVVGLLAAMLLIGGTGAVDLRVHVLVLTLPLLLRLAALTEPLPWAGRIDRRVLARAGRRFALVQLGAQLLALLARWASGAGSAPWLGVVAIVAVGTLGWFALSPRAHRRVREGAR